MKWKEKAFPPIGALEVTEPTLTFVANRFLRQKISGNTAAHNCANVPLEHRRVASQPSVALNDHFLHIFCPGNAGPSHPVHTLLSYFAGGEVVERKLNGRIGQILLAYQYRRHDLNIFKNIFLEVYFINNSPLQKLTNIFFSPNNIWISHQKATVTGRSHF